MFKSASEMVLAGRRRKGFYAKEPLLMSFYDPRLGTTRSKQSPQLSFRFSRVLMEKAGMTPGEYYDFQFDMENGQGMVCRVDETMPGTKLSLAYRSKRSPGAGNGSASLRYTVTEGIPVVSASSPAPIISVKPGEVLFELPLGAKPYKTAVATDGA